MVTSYSISDDGDEEPLENITRSFAKCEIFYKDHDAGNKSQTEIFQLPNRLRQESFHIESLVRFFFISSICLFQNLNQ